MPLKINFIYLLLLKETNTNLSETRTAITPTTDQEQELKTTNVEEDAKHMKKETQKPSFTLPHLSIKKIHFILYCDVVKFTHT